MSKAKKMTLLISIVLIIIGAVMYVAMGFNYNLSYGESKRIVVNMKNDFALEDYKTMAKEVYGTAIVETISEFREGVSIRVKESTDEQLDSLVAKINEKYGYEYTKEDISITNVPKVEVINIVKPVIVPMIVALLIILVYTVIRYRKSGILKVALNVLIPAVLSQLIVLAIYSICRIPVTNVLLPLLLAAFAVSLVYSAKTCAE